MADILIIDDSPLQTGLLSELLRRDGHQLEAADSLAKARQQQSRWRKQAFTPRICLIELLQWADNGFHIGGMIRRLKLGEPVLMCARLSEADCLWAQTQGLQFLIQRPLPVRQWQRAVQAILDQLPAAEQGEPCR